MPITRRNVLQLSLAATTVDLISPFQSAYAGTNGTAPYKPKKLYHGVAYYPELWPKEDVDKDIKEMKKLGINVARMAEFAWSTMEREEGKIDLSLFKQVMDKMYAAGIDVVLCTPTATPPIWLTYNHPERCHKNADGVIYSHGARQHASYEHPRVRAACFKIVKKMAQELGDHPGLIAWQLDNEIKAHVAEDFSDAAIKNWHGWLKKRFGKIENLNKAWGTHIWSQYYQRFEQVPAPVKTPFLHNASLTTVYKLFSRESAAEFLIDQSKIIKGFSDRPITHNDNPAFNLHHEKSMDAQDFASYDAYPTAQQWGTLIFRSDMYRAAIPGRPFWLMETSSAHNGWLGNHQPIHPKDYLQAEAVSVYALGGEAFCYWLWRQQRTGAELPHSAVMSAWFKPGVGYDEVQKVSDARKQLEPFIINSSMMPAELALTYSDHARAMIETEPMDKRDGFPKRYRGVIEMWHALIRDEGYHRDVRFEGASLSNLKLLITPAMPYVSELFIERVLDFVKRGGTWIVGPLTGTRDREHTVQTNAGIGLLDKLAGVTTNFVSPLTNTEASGRAFDLSVPLSGWCTAMTPNKGTVSIGKIENGVLSGQSFITEREIGKGRIVVLGAHPHGEKGSELLKQLIRHYADVSGVTQKFAASPGTIVSPRTTPDGNVLWIVINMNGKGGEVTLPSGTKDAFSSETLGTKLTLSRYEWRVLEIHTANQH